LHISDGILSPATCAGGYLAAGGLVALGLRRAKDADVARSGVLSASFFLASLVRVPLPGASVHLLLASLNGIALGSLCFPSIFLALLLQAVLLGHGGVATLGVNTVVMALPAYLAGLLFHAGITRRWSGRPLFYAGLAAAFALGPKFLVEALSAAGLFQWDLHRAWVPAGGAACGIILALALDKLWGLEPVRALGFSAGFLSVLGSALLFFLVLSYAPLAGGVGREAFSELARFAFAAHLPVMLIEGVAVALLIRYLDTVSPELLGIGRGEAAHTGGGKERPKDVAA